MLGMLVIEIGYGAGIGRFHGHVRDAEGAPVACALVTLIDRSGRRAGLAVADAQGRYALPAPPEGSYVPAVTASGHAPRAFTAVYEREGAGTGYEMTLTAPTARGRPGGPHPTRGDRTACRAARPLMRRPP
ncbi:carboxypeptidase regulatory-like domain-containing protein [Streptomyces sp. PKU-EA00015]|uniref:carboxypeptidase-like regulatory domain-containing protein n=1 Tax=Streptomyces sp. PKU-EA00015 TaxID=2748326 RepID=UPI0015A4AE50|nr:carboxypeptidase-like regulatory domain-containing protein [Streptomyces sp. PKU-EA00015]NWF25872.1 carboxypeptidase regulatory-like domain-containing protein [Streptomyces sp. PKU-EA00015]